MREGAEADWARRPKVELHLHLEGAAPPAFIRGLAREKGVDLAGLFAEDGGYRTGTFDHFLRAYEAACSVLTTPEDYRRLTLAVLEASAASGVVYTEAFISPDLCGGADPAAFRDHCAAVADAAAEAEARGGPALRLIAIGLRHLGPERMRRAAVAAAEADHGILTGWGMAGAETVLRPRDFSWAFDCAREAGLSITCHAGEWGGPDMVADTLTDLRPSRIGHGIAAARDPALMDRLAEAGTVLEVCPGSNVYLHAVPSWEAHPIERLRAREVKVTVSTDDPPWFGTTLAREWAMLERTFGWGEDDLAALNAVALDAAFCDQPTRDRIKTRLEAP